MKKTLFLSFLLMLNVIVIMSASGSSLVKGRHFLNNTLKDLDLQWGSKQDVTYQIPAKSSRFISEPVLSKNDLRVKYAQSKDNPINLTLDAPGTLAHQSDVRSELNVVQENSGLTFNLLRSFRNNHVLFNGTDKDLYYAWVKKSPNEAMFFITDPCKVEQNSFEAIFKPEIDGSQEYGLLLFTTHENNFAGSAGQKFTNNTPHEFKYIPANSIRHEAKSHVMVDAQGKLDVQPSNNKTVDIINSTNQVVGYAVVLFLTTTKNYSQILRSPKSLHPQMRGLIDFPQTQTIGEEVRLVIGNKDSDITLDLLNKPDKEFVHRRISDPIFNDTLIVGASVKARLNIFSSHHWPSKLLPTLLWLTVPSKNNYSYINQLRIEKDIIKKFHEQTFARQQQSQPLVVQGSILELPKEKAYVQERLTGKVREGFAKFMKSDRYTKMPQSKIPRVALVFTGGGYRAMIVATGFLQGAQDEGLLDCCLYMCGLSGSTWALTGWLASSRSIDDFADVRLPNKVQLQGDGNPTGLDSLIGLFKNVVNDQGFVERSLIQTRYNQYQGWVGFYGHALGHALLKDTNVNDNTTHHITLSDLQTNLDSDQYPLPLCVALDSDGLTEKNHEWIEASPYNVLKYSQDQNTKHIKKISSVSADDSRFGAVEVQSVETEKFGSIVNNGNLIHRHPEHTLAHFLGIFGSAFAVDVGDGYKKSSPIGIALTFVDGLDRTAIKILRDLGLQEKSKFGSNSLPAHSNRLTEALIPNFAHQSERNEKEYHHLIDGGILKIGENRHNFASIPALARGVDMLIMCDATDSPEQDSPKHLLATYDEAKALGLPFPEITDEHKDKIRKQRATLIDGGQTKPLVVYMKARKDDEILPGRDPFTDSLGYTSTENFNYSAGQYADLKQLARGIIGHDDTLKCIRKAFYLASQRIT